LWRVSYFYVVVPAVLVVGTAVTVAIPELAFIAVLIIAVFAARTIAALTVTVASTVRRRPHPRINENSLPAAAMPRLVLLSPEPACRAVESRPQLRLVAATADERAAHGTGPPNFQGGDAA
jgi:hypothetical protein